MFFVDQCQYVEKIHTIPHFSSLCQRLKWRVACKDQNCYIFELDFMIVLDQNRISYFLYDIWPCWHENLLWIRVISALIDKFYFKFQYNDWRRSRLVMQVIRRKLDFLFPIFSQQRARMWMNQALGCEWIKHYKRSKSLWVVTRPTNCQKFFA